MAKRGSEEFVPRVGQPHPIRFVQGDELDLIPWIASKGLTNGEWSAWVRQMLREKMQAEAEGAVLLTEPQFDRLADRVAEKLLVRLPQGSGLEARVVREIIEDSFLDDSLDT